MDPYDFHVDEDDDDDEIDIMWLDNQLEGLQLDYNGLNFNLDLQMLNNHLFMIDSDDDDYIDDFLDFDNTDDSEYSDSDDHNKIFVTLQDSGLLKKINFHKALNDGRYRLPRNLVQPPNFRRTETYESLYRVLDELHLLLKAWKKRTQHSLTAHIQRNGGASGDESCGSSKRSIRFGEDYMAADVEHESDGNDGDQGAYHGAAAAAAAAAASASEFPNSFTSPSHGGIKNIPLTKKKFCQSTRLFHEIFSNDGDFSQFQAYIHRIRKEVYGTLFNLFLLQLPEDARLKLPNELWEKIWRMTQTPYTEVAANTYSVGYRFSRDAQLRLWNMPKDGMSRCKADIQKLLVEQDRVSNLFGAVGNLHMLVFEVLFKHPYITETPPLLEVNSLDVKERDGTSYAKAIFDRYRRTLIREHERYLSLDYLEQGSEDVLKPGAMDKLHCVSSGNFTIRRQNLPAMQAISNRSTFKMVIRESEFCVTCSGSAPVIAQLEYYMEADSQPNLRVLLWHVKENRQIAVIYTSCTLLDVCYGRNKNSTNQLFALTNDRFAFIKRSTDKEKDTYMLYQWKYSLSWGSSKSNPAKELVATDGYAVLRGDLAVNPEPNTEFSDRTIICLKGTVLPDVGAVWLLHHQNPYNLNAVGSTLHIIACEQNEDGVSAEVDRIEFPKHLMHLVGVKDTRVLFHDEHNKLFSMVSLTSKRRIAEYPWKELCRDENHKHDAGVVAYLPECKYEAKFDLNPDRHEFVIFSQNLTCFQLLSYDPLTEEAPEVIASGSAFVYNMHYQVLSKTVLVDGLLWAAPPQDVVLRSHSGDYFRDDQQVTCLDVFAFDLRGQEVQPVVTLLHSNSDIEPVSEIVLTNDHSRRFFADILKHQYPYFADDRTLLLPMAASYLSIELMPNPGPVIQSDSEQLYRRYQKEKASVELAREQKRREEESRALERRKEIERTELLTKYAKVKQEVEGRICHWNHSYGFLKPQKPADAKKLNNIFVHISEIKNREKRWVKMGQKMRFTIESSNEKFRAVNANFI